VLLDQLLQNGDEKPKRGRRKSAERAARAVRRPAAKKVETNGHTVTDARSVQVKAAVRPSEKPVFERLAELRDKTLSDLIRDFLVREAEREHLL
jgi:hypothetical protein